MSVTNPESRPVQNRALNRPAVGEKALVARDHRMGQNRTQGDADTIDV